MKNLFTIFALFAWGLMVAQQSENRFQNSENPVDVSSADAQNLGPGGPPGDDDPPPVPIDDYIPVLLTGAIGIIFYETYKKRKFAIES